jgi:hypothetical protein
MLPLELRLLAGWLRGGRARARRPRYGAMSARAVLSLLEALGGYSSRGLCAYRSYSRERPRTQMPSSAPHAHPGARRFFSRIRSTIKACDSADSNVVAIPSKAGRLV